MTRLKNIKDELVKQLEKTEQHKKEVFEEQGTGSFASGYVMGKALGLQLAIDAIHECVVESLF